MGFVARRAGYRPFALPPDLAALERGEASAADSGCALVAADRVTLIWSQDLDDGTRAVVKMYRGRSLASWTRERLFRFRVQREFDALTFLATEGIACSKPLFWSRGSCEEFGRHEVLATLEIPAALRMDAFIRSRAEAPQRAVVGATYGVLRRMHEKGFHHGAMYERNVLIGRSAAEPDIHIIDTPKAIRFPYAIVGTRMAWIDLADLSRGLVDALGQEETSTWLAHYGMAAPERQRFLAGLERYHPDRHTRNFHGAECQMWELLARLGVRHPAA